MTRWQLNMYRYPAYLVNDEMTAYLFLLSLSIFFTIEALPWDKWDGSSQLVLSNCHLWLHSK